VEAIVAAVIQKNKRNAARNSEKVVHPCVDYRNAIDYYRQQSEFSVTVTVSRVISFVV